MLKKFALGLCFAGLPLATLGCGDDSSETFNGQVVTATTTATTGTTGETETTGTTAGTTGGTTTGTTGGTTTGTTGGTTGLSSAFAKFDTTNTTIMIDGTNVVIETNGLPNHTSPYWSNTTARSSPDGMGPGTPAAAVNHPLFVTPTVTSFASMAPGNIDDFVGTFSLTVPANPGLASQTSATNLGPIGIAVSGAVIYDDQEGPNVPLNNAIPSLDYVGAHTGPQSYHYHLEPKAFSNDDDALIGIISDGFFVYGRRCPSSEGVYPTDLDASGGHTSATPDSAVAIYHYHIKNELLLGQYYVIFPGDYQGTPNAIQ